MEKKLPAKSCRSLDFLRRRDGLEPVQEQGKIWRMHEGSAMDTSIEKQIETITGHLLPDTSPASGPSAPRTILERMRELHTPGVSIAVINNFQVEWARGFGVSDAELSTPATTETMFQAASLSKPMTALAIMRLVAQGVLDLDEDVNTYLKSWKLSSTADCPSRVILRHLLSHAGGVTVDGFPGYRRTATLPSLPQILNGIHPANTSRVEVDIPPGSQFRYSGGGYLVVQQVMIDVMGMTFPEVMAELILGPLEMSNSTFEQPLPPALEGRVATAYPSKGLSLEGRFHTYPEMAAAGLWSTPTDVARVGVELQRCLKGESQTLLTKETLESMFCPPLPKRSRGGHESVGLGLYSYGEGPESYLEDSGWNEGFLSLIRIYKHTGKGFAAMINSNEGGPLILEIRSSIARAYDWPELPPLPSQTLPE
jgi:CubicO group peptidase (beta-lactamase class C family)